MRKAPARPEPVRRAISQRQQRPRDRSIPHLRIVAMPQHASVQRSCSIRAPQHSPVKQRGNQKSARNIRKGPCKAKRLSLRPVALVPSPNFEVQTLLARGPARWARGGQQAFARRGTPVAGHRPSASWHRVGTEPETPPGARAALRWLPATKRGCAWPWGPWTPGI